MPKQITAIIERDGDGYVSLCPELDIASQGNTVTEACDNLREALELFFETASPDEIHVRRKRKRMTTGLILLDQKAYRTSGQRQARQHTDIIGYQ